MGGRRTSSARHSNASIYKHEFNPALAWHVALIEWGGLLDRVQRAQLLSILIECTRDHQSPVVFESDESAIKGSVDMRRKQQPIEFVEPLGIRGVFPRLDVARPQQRNHVQMGERTSPIPVAQKLAP